MSKKLKVFTCIMLIISIMSALTVSSVALNETEPNGEYSQAKRIYDDTNNYGYISTSTDVDWWVISFDIEGFANFYLGSLPKNYKMQIYKNNGSNLIATSNEASNYNELFRIRVYTGINYYIKISGSTSSVYDASDSYKLRCKVYALKPARFFSVDENNGWYDVFVDESLINTRQQAQNVIPSLWSLDFTATEYLNNSADAATSVYSTSDIIVVSTHGAPGILGYNNSILYGSSNQTNNNAYKSIYYDVSDASELDLVIYSSCESGVTSTNGNLVDITLDKGAYACFGWRCSQYTSLSAEWLDILFENLAIGKTVAEAMTIADEYIDSRWTDEAYEVVTNRYCGESPATDKLILGGY